jgi:hypothetical protein
MKCTNFEWMNYAQFPLLSHEMLGLWSFFRHGLYKVCQNATKNEKTLQRLEICL